MLDIQDFDWKIPKLKPGMLIRFNYWDSEFKTLRGWKGYVHSIRHLSSNPVSEHSKKEYSIKRGSTLYTIYVLYYGKRQPMSFYNQRMSSVEILKNWHNHEGWKNREY